MSENERVVLSPVEAEAMLPEGEMIHTFRQAGYALIGADWKRSEIIKAFQTRKPELSGEQATAMKHGIVFFDDHGAVFVETVANKGLHPTAAGVESAGENSESGGG